MTPIQLATKAIEESADSGAAVDAMLAWMAEHPDWEHEHLPSMRAAWANIQIAGVLAQQRREAMVRAAKASSSNTDAKPVVNMAEALRENYRRMIDMPLWGGKRLGDATAPEIAESARRFHQSSKTMLRSARFHDAIAQEMARLGADADTPAHAVLTAADIDRIWEKTDAA